MQWGSGDVPSDPPGAGNQKPVHSTPKPTNKFHIESFQNFRTLDTGLLNAPTQNHLTLTLPTYQSVNMSEAQLAKGETNLPPASAVAPP
jgi:hypothetical protein